MDNNGSGGGNGREVGRAGGWAGVGGKGRKVYLNNNNIFKKYSLLGLRHLVSVILAKILNSCVI